MIRPTPALVAPALAAPALVAPALAVMLGVSATAMGATLPVPPIPPANPPRDELAPVPNADARMPIDPSSTRVRVRPQMFPASRPDTSMGFVPGSRYQSTDERKPLQTPGVKLTVPIP